MKDFDVVTGPAPARPKLSTPRTRSVPTSPGLSAPRGGEEKIRESAGMDHRSGDAEREA